mmetsp:Transcript_15218/g.37927  ORF Transcript_15218/g.37927 Transcript_15218/m.37927 type:complete len:208 (-) Transcript_15218:711-1334(-)
MQAHPRPSSCCSVAMNRQHWPQASCKRSSSQETGTQPARSACRVHRRRRYRAACASLVSSYSCRIWVAMASISSLLTPKYAKKSEPLGTTPSRDLASSTWSSTPLMGRCCPSPVVSSARTAAPCASCPGSCLMAGGATPALSCSLVYARWLASHSAAAAILSGGNCRHSVERKLSLTKFQVSCMSVRYEEPSSPSSPSLDICDTRKV